MAYIIRGGDQEYKNYPPATLGLHRAVCVDLVEQKPEDFKGDGDFRPKVRLVWQIKELREDGKRHTLSRKYTASLHEKAHLRKHLDSWRGKPFTPEELAEWDLEKVLGINCTIQVVHNAGDNGKVWANVEHVMPASKEGETLHPVDYVRVKDRQESNGGNGPEGRSTFEANTSDVPF